MLSATYGVSLSVGGISFQQAIVRQGELGVPIEVSLPAGKAGTLTTRTDDNTGIVTAVAHGLAQNDLVDLFWSGGVRYGMTVGVVAGNDVPIDLGAGDVLPADDTPVVITKQVQINATIDGDALSILGLVLETTEVGGKGHVDLQDAGSASIEALSLVANTPKVYDIAGGAANVFTGNPITKLLAANGSSAQAATLKLGALVDPTP